MASATARLLSKWRRTDQSPVVRLALASALPSLPDEERWRIAEALAMHGEDADDRFLPKMIWYGIAPLVEKDPARAFALAGRTPLASLADSILWYAGSDDRRSRQARGDGCATRTTMRRSICCIAFVQPGARRGGADAEGLAAGRGACDVASSDEARDPDGAAQRGLWRQGDPREDARIAGGREGRDAGAAPGVRSFEARGRHGIGGGVREPARQRGLPPGGHTVALAFGRCAAARRL